jgi:hypothetical protein
MKVNGWDERDYRLWSQIQSLPSYGLVGGRADNPMIALKDVVGLLESAANLRYRCAHPNSHVGFIDGQARNFCNLCHEDVTEPSA